MAVDAELQAVVDGYLAQHGREAATQFARNVQAYARENGVVGARHYAKALATFTPPAAAVAHSPRASATYVAPRQSVAMNVKPHFTAYGPNPDNTVTVDPYSPNPLADEIALIKPQIAEAARAQSEPWPGLFTSGDLPPITSSDLTGAQLAAMPWQARVACAMAPADQAAEWAAKYTPSDSSVAEQVALEASLAFNDHPAVQDAVQRMRLWLSSWGSVLDPNTQRIVWLRKDVYGQPLRPELAPKPLLPKQMDPSQSREALVKADNERALKVFRRRHGLD